jgi:hypothetical protein
MSETPFELMHCSWPRPIEPFDKPESFEPEWNAPVMPGEPQARWEMLHGNQNLTIDWRAWFRGGLKYQSPQQGGEMRGFYVVFHIRIHNNGTLIFWSDGTCLIRRNGKVIRSSKHNEVTVRIGDSLEIAQCQNAGEWKWGARIILSDQSLQSAIDTFLPYLRAVQMKLEIPNGPPLKTFCSGKNPICTVVSLYSMILKGYTPSEVLLFGEHQWPRQTYAFFETLLPFAKVIPTEALIEHLRSFNYPLLIELAQRFWTVMKVSCSLLYSPAEHCYMDDDIFILNPVEDALSAFQHCNLVFGQDNDYTDLYLSAWPELKRPLRTGTINTGLYWLRNALDAKKIATDMISTPRVLLNGWQWDQGFIASRYAHEAVFGLPTQRYLYPMFDGLPGGILGYDYARNPCGFASIHFGGLAEKPTDKDALILAPQILRGSKGLP